MVEDIYVFEDIISKEKQDILEAYFKDDTIDWKEGNNIWYVNVPTPQGVLKPDQINNEKVYAIIEEIEQNVLSKLNLIYLDTYRFKVNRLLADPKYAHHDNRISIHIDRSEAHIAMVYYINSADGDTKFYKLENGTLSKWKTYIEEEDYSKFKEIYSVKPNKGSIAVFNGHTPHHSSYPANSNRYVINFNTVPVVNTGALL